jgi:ABC-type dipeptide/oligopeptide/nickel transport system ATPase component
MAIKLTIEPHKLTFLTGNSGAGKSTFFRLLLGFYPPYTGTLKIDGLDIREFSPTSLRRHISFVNGIFTYKGGKHVDYLLQQILKKLTAYILKKKKMGMVCLVCFEIESPPEPVKLAKCRGCSFHVHSNPPADFTPEQRSFCCSICQSSKGRKHGGRCEQAHP